MRHPIIFCTCFCVALFLISCGNSNSNTQYGEELDSVVVECDDETPSSHSSSDDDDITPDDVIKASLMGIKTSLPMEMFAGMTITDVYLKGSYIFYHVECDDNIISVYDLSDKVDESHNNILNFLKTMASNDANTALFLAALVEKHMGICYRYVSDESGDYLDIKIKYSELSNLF